MSHPVFYGDLVYNLRRVKWEANVVSSDSKIVERLSTSKVWPSDHLEDDRSSARPFYSIV